MAYTKKELIEAMACLNDDALIKINIIEHKADDDDGDESGFLLDIDAFATNGENQGQIVGYDL